jgi:hypothetical protein
MNGKLDEFEWAFLVTGKICRKSFPNEIFLLPNGISFQSG